MVEELEFLTVMEILSFATVGQVRSDRKFLNFKLQPNEFQDLKISDQCRVRLKFNDDLNIAKISKFCM